MFSFFKRRRLRNVQPKKPGYFSKMLNPLLMRFASQLNRQEKRYSITQKKAILIVFCSGIVAIHLFNIYLATKSSIPKSRFPEHHTITTPKDITLPDSLDIELIKLYREMKRKQDSLTSSTGK